MLVTIIAIQIGEDTRANKAIASRMKRLSTRKSLISQSPSKAEPLVPFDDYNLPEPTRNTSNIILHTEIIRDQSVTIDIHNEWNKGTLFVLFLFILTSISKGNSKGTTNSISIA